MQEFSLSQLKWQKQYLQRQISMVRQKQDEMKETLRELKYANEIIQRELMKVEEAINQHERS